MARVLIFIPSLSENVIESTFYRSEGVILIPQISQKDTFMPLSKHERIAVIYDLPLKPKPPLSSGSIDALPSANPLDGDYDYPERILRGRGHFYRIRNGLGFVVDYETNKGRAKAAWNSADILTFARRGNITPLTDEEKLKWNVK